MRKEISSTFSISQGFSETFLERFWKKINKLGPIPKSKPELGPCWIWTAGRFSFGYGAIRMGGRGSRTIKAHAASWVIHRGEIPKHLCVCHHCDNPPCCNPDHLFLGTTKDNSMDMHSKGRFTPKSGESCNFHVLNKRQVLEIRKRYSLGNETQEEIARCFGTSQSNVHVIVSKITWKHI